LQGPGYSELVTRKLGVCAEQETAELTFSKLAECYFRFSLIPM